MSLGQWSTTAANNATADPSINWQEGQAPSTVNDSARAMMAALATWFQAAEWLNYALTPTYVSGTSFTLAGDQTSIYTVGRRVRTFNTGGTVYGTISASVYTTLTTVTITPDSGALDSGLSEVDVGIMNPVHTSFPSGLSIFANVLNATGGIETGGLFVNADVSPVSLANNQGTFYVWNESSGSGATSLVNNQGGGGGGFIFRNVNFPNTVETGRVTFSASGSIISTGGITSGGSISATGSLSATGTVSAAGNITSTGGNVISSGPTYAGGASGAFLGTNGDISGSNWGGSLSAWLGANKLSVGTNAYVHTPNDHNYVISWDGTKINFVVDSVAVASLQGAAVSDRRAKTKIRSAEKRDSLGLIEQTRFRSFDFKKKFGAQHVPVGVIAQEVTPDWVIDGEILHLNERVMLADALHAIKQLSARVQALEAELAQR